MASEISYLRIVLNTQCNLSCFWCHGEEDRHISDPGLPITVYSFLFQPQSSTQAVLYAINLGADTDTIAAMTGAISGAYLGVESIPGRWRDRLENRHYIEELAEKLWLEFIGKRKFAQN